MLHLTLHGKFKPISLISQGWWMVGWVGVGSKAEIRLQFSKTCWLKLELCLARYYSSHIIPGSDGDDYYLYYITGHWSGIRLVYMLLISSVTSMIVMWCSCVVLGEMTSFDTDTAPHYNKQYSSAVCYDNQLLWRCPCSVVFNLTGILFCSRDEMQLTWHFGSFYNIRSYNADVSSM